MSSAVPSDTPTFRSPTQRTLYLVTGLLIGRDAIYGELKGQLYLPRRM